MNNDTTTMLSYDVQKKSAGMAYVLLIFLGWFGIQNFYLRRTGMALTQLLTGIGGLVILIAAGSLEAIEHPANGLFAIGTLCWIINWILYTIDLFSLWHFTKQHNANLLFNLNKGKVSA